MISRESQVRPPPSEITSLPGGFVIREAVPADLDATARAHVRLLPVGLFPSMGTRFLRRWHQTFLCPPHGVAFVVTHPSAPGQGVVGFLLGSTDQAAHTAGVLANRRVLAGLIARGTLAFVRRPRIAVRFVRTRGRAWLARLLRRPRPEPAQHGAARPRSVAVLAAISVEPSARGHGLGAHLVRQFLATAWDRGADAAELVTATRPDGAGRFYQRLGWRPAGERVTRDGTTVCTYLYPLRSSGEASSADGGGEGHGS